MLHSYKQGPPLLLLSLFMARDAITVAEKNKLSCGILDTDYMAAFDYLVMHWVFKILARKGVREQVI